MEWFLIIWVNVSHGAHRPEYIDSFQTKAQCEQVGEALKEVRFGPGYGLFQRDWVHGVREDELHECRNLSN